MCCTWHAMNQAAGKWPTAVPRLRAYTEPLAENMHQKINLKKALQGVDTHPYRVYSPPIDSSQRRDEMDFYLPQALRDSLLEYMEAREGNVWHWAESRQGTENGALLPNEEVQLAAQLRDLKPLREIKEPA